MHDGKNVHRPFSYLVVLFQIPPYRVNTSINRTASGEKLIFLSIISHSSLSRSSHSGDEVNRPKRVIQFFFSSLRRSSLFRCDGNRATKWPVNVPCGSMVPLVSRRHRMERTCARANESIRISRVIYWSVTSSPEQRARLSVERSRITTIRWRRFSSSRLMSFSIKSIISYVHSVFIIVNPRRLTNPLNVHVALLNLNLHIPCAIISFTHIRWARPEPINWWLSWKFSRTKRWTSRETNEAIDRLALFVC